VDHVHDDEDEQQGCRPPSGGAVLLRELGDHKRQATDYRADQGKVQAKEEGVTKAEITAELLAAGECKQADQYTHRKERSPHCRQLLQGHSHARTRH
jgi:hypothetical protein